MTNQPNQNQMEHFIAKCKEFNLKVTPQRIAIYREVINRKTHPTTDEIFQSIKKDFPFISFDTVNRTLLTFSQIGILSIIESYSGARRFDPDLKKHHHMHCIKCGKIIDFENDEYDQIKIPPQIRQKFKILNARVVLNGYCDSCLQK